jgi:hypothetical protein
MTGPSWLAAVFGVVMLVAAAASLLRIISARRTGRRTDYDIDIHNVLMGVSMAGMLIPSLLIVTAGPSTVAWFVGWVLIAIWFAVGVARDAARRTGGVRFNGHHIPHLVMSAAMAYMFGVLLVPAGPSGHSSMSGMSGMSTAAGGGLVPLATLDYAFVIFMVAYTVLVVDRLPTVAALGPVSARFAGPAVPAPAAAATRSLAPASGAVINIVMAITMAYMLVMMFA